MQLAIMHAAFRPRRYAAAVDADELILGALRASLSKVITLQPTKEAQASHCVATRRRG